MPRAPRLKSQSGIYHIMLRGINQQVIFEDEEDYLKFIETLKDYKAGMVEKLDEYVYSSYNEYKKDSNSFIDKNFVYGIIDKDFFEKYNEEKNEDKCLEIDDSVFRLSDADAKKEIKKASGCENASDFQGLDIIKRDKCIKKLRDMGLSIRQISRLTGVSFSIIRKL